MPTIKQKISACLWFDNEAEDAAGFGREGSCGWLKDRYGLSWQVVPAMLGAMVTDVEAAIVDRVMNAILKMKKLDLDALKRAHAR